MYGANVMLKTKNRKPVLEPVMVSYTLVEFMKNDGHYSVHNFHVDMLFFRFIPFDIFQI